MDEKLLSLDDGRCRMSITADADGEAVTIETCHCSHDLNRDQVIALACALTKWLVSTERAEPISSILATSFPDGWPPKPGWPS